MPLGETWAEGGGGGARFDVTERQTGGEGSKGVDLFCVGRASFLMFLEPGCEHGSVLVDGWLKGAVGKDLAGASHAMQAQSIAFSTFSSRSRISSCHARAS